MKRLMSQDLDTETVQIAHDDGEGGLFLETKQNITPFLEQNKNSYARIDERARWGEFTHIASIPLYCYTTVKQGGDTKRVSHSRA
jgi:hypothetical protein